MKTKTLLAATFIFSTLLFSGCNTDGPCVRSGGSLSKETRNASSFAKIDLSIDANVNVYEDSTLESPSVEIEAPEKILDHITTKVNGNTLEIDSKKCIKNAKDITVWVRLPKLEGTYINGSGDIIGQTAFHTSSFDGDINGSGNIELEIYVTNKMSLNIDGSGNCDMWGTASSQKAKINGSGNIKTKGLTVEKCTIIINGSGDCFVHPTNTLDVDINGSGNVHYSGNPANVSISIDGSGDVIKE